MASMMNAKGLTWDGKSKMVLGKDENLKILEGVGDELIITNTDGSLAKVSPENIVGMPEDVSDTNKLVTQKDLSKMMNKIMEAMRIQAESMQVLFELAQIVGDSKEE